MSEIPYKGPGRPRGDGKCIDCKRAGVIDPPLALYNSYCREHQRIRQAASRQRQRIRVWSNLGVLCVRCRNDEGHNNHKGLGSTVLCYGCSQDMYLEIYEKAKTIAAEAGRNVPVDIKTLERDYPDEELEEVIHDVYKVDPVMELAKQYGVVPVGPPVPEKPRKTLADMHPDLVFDEQGRVVIDRD